MFERFACLFIFLCLLASQAIIAQTGGRVTGAGTSFHGSIHGIVKENKAGVIPGAVLTLITPAGAKRTETAKDDGTFNFVGLDAGTYMLTVDYPGLQALQTLVLKVKAGESSIANMTMVARPSKQELTAVDSSNK